MNLTVKKLLAAILTLSATQVSAHTNKTFLTPRSQGVQLPLEFTTFNELVNRCCHDKFGANFEITGYYQASTNKDALGRYFGAENKHKFTLSTKLTTDNNQIAQSADFPVDMFDLLHNRSQNQDQANTFGGTTTLELEPEHKVWGVTINYHQDLDKLLCGLFIRANLPIAHVENNVDLNVASSVAQRKTDLINFFKGQFDGFDQTNNKMNRLSNAKIDGRQSVTSVADIDLALGYKLMNSDNCMFSLAIALTIPTGTEADGRWVFEPLVGNGNHVGLGGDLNLLYRVWGDECHNVDLNLVLKYRYLFEASERRTFGLKNRNWGQYVGLAKDGDQVITPAANVLTLNTDITPGSQLDSILSMAYNNSGFTLDLGYNMFFKESEEAKLKGGIKANTWYVAGRNYNTNAAFVSANDAEKINSLVKALANDDISTASAETPSQWTHGIFGGLGYTFIEWEYPLLLGVGGKYEWASENSAPENWAVWAKVGVGF